MNINFYKTTNENNVVYKTLTGEIAFENCVLREKSSVITPTIFVNTNTDICAYNYCYIPEFKRYYYITDIVSVNNNYWQISLKVDVLMSYKEELSKIKGIMLRSEKKFNTYINDEKFKVLNYNRIQTKVFPNSHFTKNLNFVLTTVGHYNNNESGVS